MTTGNNVFYTLSAKDSYVFSMSVRGGNKELKRFVLDQNGYEWLGSEYKRKKRLYPREIKVTEVSGKKIKKIVDEKQVVFYSEKYAKKARANRAVAIVTSEYKKSADSIIEMYRGLWRIEESFKVTKSDLKSRPVYVSREDHIKAHFLTCFIALVIARILELKLNRKYSISKIIESLQKCNCTNIQQNYYFFDYYDEVLKDIGDTFNIDFST